MITCAKDGVFNPLNIPDLAHVNNHNLYSTLFASSEPKGFNIAAKFIKRVYATNKEMDALRKNNIWTLVPHPSNGNVGG
jgi:hypothetical protein